MIEKAKKRTFYGEDLKRKNLTKGCEVLPARFILLSIFIPLKYANCNNGEFIQAGIRTFDLHARRNRGVISMQLPQKDKYITWFLLRWTICLYFNAHVDKHGWPSPQALPLSVTLRRYSLLWSYLVYKCQQADYEGVTINGSIARLRRFTSHTARCFPPRYKECWSGTELV